MPALPASSSSAAHLLPDAPPAASANEPAQTVGPASYRANPADPIPESTGVSPRSRRQVPAPASPPDVSGMVLAVIGERTGYPEELIEPDLDLEADLSIDSIKRAEVVGEVAGRLGLSTSDESAMEKLVRSRTVRLMVAALEQQLSGQPAAALKDPVPAEKPWSAAAASGLAAPAAGPAPDHTSGRSTGRRTRRMTVETVTAALPAGSAAALADARFLLTGAPEAVDALAARLGEYGATTVSRQDDPADVNGLVLLDALEAGSEGLLPDSVSFLQSALACAPRWLVAVGRSRDPLSDGLPGLFRTLALEYPATTVRYVEVESAASIGKIAERVIDELTADATEAVVRYVAGVRQGEQVTATELGRLAISGAGSAGDGIAEARALGLGEDSVVVLLGGARGITARFALTLAAAARCRIELVGRTPLPTQSEEADLAGAGDLPALRAALTRRGMRSPADIEKLARSVLAGREVAATVAELAGLGAQVRYHALDVRDTEAIHRVLKQIHDDHGRVDGLVHGAGIIEDKLFADKTPESFARVYATKVDGAAAALDGLDQCGATPSFVVLFGSIAAVYGSRGQTDYAAANDALESMSARWAAVHGRRCLTVHWGPWAPSGSHDGMVTPELVGEYARRGIGLIDPVDGAHSLLRELAWADPAPTSVIYSA